MSFENPKSANEIMRETLEPLQEEYASLAIDQELQMTEDNYRKIVSIKTALPDIEKYEEGALSEEMLFAYVHLSVLVSERIEEMEEYYDEHGNKWDESVE